MAINSLTGTQPDLLQVLRDDPELRIDQDTYNIHVTANFGDVLTADEVFQQFVSFDGARKPTHLYFHVPLCSYVCHFCNYVKRLQVKRGSREEELDRWTAALIRESQYYLDRAPWLREARIESMYLGGGTASLLREKHLAQIVEHVHKNYDMSDCKEISLEGNPDNYLEDEPQRARALGFNRFSVGVQSLRDEVNKFSGRGHDSAMSLQALDNLLSLGCPVNADMMFGLPIQNPDDVAEDIERLIQVGVPTVTVYRFRNAEREKMGVGNRSVWNMEKVRDRLHEEKKFKELEETYLTRQKINDVFLKHDYRPSPCLWWSAPNTYPDGNIPQVSKNKWQNFDTMVAIGPGAYGWLTGGNDVIFQTHNEADISEYLRRVEADEFPVMAFGRKLEGINAIAVTLAQAYNARQPIHLSRFKKLFGVDLLRDEPYARPLDELVQKGYLDKQGDNGGLSLTPTILGEAFSHEIISSFISKLGVGCVHVCGRY